MLSCFQKEMSLKYQTCHYLITFLLMKYGDLGEGESGAAVCVPFLSFKPVITISKNTADIDSYHIEEIIKYRILPLSPSCHFRDT